jgi:outer membrane protein TolC
MRGLYLFCLAFLFLTQVSFALDWVEGLKEVSLNNPEMLAAKNQLQSAQFQEKSGRSGFLPKVSAAAGTTYTDTVKTNSLSVSATENLFAGFSDVAKMDQASYAREAAEANLQNVKAKVSYDYKASFMNLLYAQKYITLTSDIINRRQANLKLVQLRFESGRENIGSLHLSRAYLAQAKYDHLIATNALEVAQSQLAKVLGKNDIKDDEILEAVGVVPVSNPDAEMTKLNFKNLTIATAEFQKALLDEKTSLAAIDLSKSSFYPSLNLSQSATRLNRDAGAWNNNWAIGAELSFPLFNGGKDYYTFKSSHELYRSSVMTKKNVQDSTLVKLKDAYAKLTEAIYKLEVDISFVQAGSSRERIAKEKYNNGLLTFDEWDIIENDLIGRQKTLVQTERDRVVAEAYWEQVQGKGVLQ